MYVFIFINRGTTLLISLDNFSLIFSFYAPFKLTAALAIGILLLLSNALQAAGSLSRCIIPFGDLFISGMWPMAHCGIHPHENWCMWATRMPPLLSLPDKSIINAAAAFTDIGQDPFQPTPSKKSNKNVDGVNVGWE